MEFCCKVGHAEKIPTEAQNNAGKISEELLSTPTPNSLLFVVNVSKDVERESRGNGLCFVGCCDEQGVSKTTVCCWKKGELWSKEKNWQKQSVFNVDIYKKSHDRFLIIFFFCAVVRKTIDKILEGKGENAKVKADWQLTIGLRLV